MPDDLFNESFRNHDNNTFVRILRNHFSDEIAKSLIQRYLIGTSDYRPGATVFHQVDRQGNVRASKLMLYNEDTKKRIQNIPFWPHWVHTQKKLHDFNLVQCLFGEHILALEPKNKIIALFESEKTAIVMSVYLPEFICLACGGSDGFSLNHSRCKALRGRDVILYPDLNKFESWRKKAQEYQDFANFKVAEHTEKLLRDIVGKVDAKDPDMCDYILSKFPKYPGLR